MLIDVRDLPDFAGKHIAQSVNIPLDRLPEQLVKLGEHKEKPLLIACQDGIRSASAAKILTKAGFQQIFVIIGGINAWEDDYKLPVTVSNKNKTKSKTNP
jgi:rhodanese-related sulfurtransferase